MKAGIPAASFQNVTNVRVAVLALSGPKKVPTLRAARVGDYVNPLAIDERMAEALVR